MKRIALVILTRHIQSLGGIGFFAASFVKLVHEKDFIVDLIVDRPLTKDSLAFEELKRCTIIAPKDSLAYGYANKLAFFEKRKTPIELFVNFQRAIIEAHRNAVYDFIFINSLEATPGILHSNIHRLVHTALYTHDGPFFSEYPDSLKDYGEILDTVFNCPLITQTQSTGIDSLEKAEKTYIPMPSLESDLLLTVKPKPEKGTAYYCASYSTNKRPEVFLKFCIEHKKKALVITNANGKEYFEDEFGKAGVEHEVRTNIFGEEKIKFIARGEMCFHPSENEFYPYAVLEAMRFMPVLAFEEKWVSRFPPNIIQTIPKYSAYSNEEFFQEANNTKRFREAYINMYFFETDQRHRWRSYVSDRSINLGKSSSGALDKVLEVIKKESGISVETFWDTILKRPTISYSDLVSFYKISKDVPVENTVDKSFFGVTIEESSLNDFF